MDRKASASADGVVHVGSEDGNLYAAGEQHPQRSHCTKMSRVNSPSEHEAVVARLWQEHLRATFPAGLRGAERAGIDMVLLDAGIAGCVSTWQNNGGVLDSERHRILRDCIADLGQVLPLLNEAEDFRYFQRLRQLAQLVSDTGSQPTS
ncbi:hypothetical protein [Streptomyces cavernae]|uniref:hypothetical protein n=1 Tax=Streptomyces cavernae TaxID=2259034 RepID=UPI001EE40ADA|nr:hypothetical protein [Streptomyces cavernae]